VTIRHSGATKLSHGARRSRVRRETSLHGYGTSIAESIAMNRQWKGAALAICFVAAFVASIAFHSIVAAVIVLLSAISVTYVISIAWMRTSTHRERGKQHSLR
jgi:hypothetical protein